MPSSAASALEGPGATISRGVAISIPPKTTPRSSAGRPSRPEFDAIFARAKAKGIPYRSGPHSHTDGRINTRRGGRGFYFEDPYGHLLEVMTVPETGS